MDAAGVELLVATDPSEHGVAHRLRRLVVLRPPVRARPRPPASRSGGGAARMRPGRSAPSSWPATNVVAYPDHYVQSHRAPPDGANSRPSSPSAGSGRMRIGVEMDNYYYSAAAHAVLGRCLPDAEFVDATGLVNWERAVKSPRELDYMRTAGRIVTRMHERIAEIAEPGRRKNDIAAEILRVGIEGLPDAGGGLPGHRPPPPLRGGRLRRPPHLERRSAPRGGGHVLRDRRLLPPLSLPLVPDRLSRGATGPGPPSGSGPPRSDGGGARARPGRKHLQRRGGRLPSAPSRSTASTRTAAPATRSGSPIHPTGASARSASGEATGPSSAPA